MQLRRSADTAWYRSALVAALAAMCLLLLGPIISQSQSGDGHHTHHDEGHGHSASRQTHHAPTQASDQMASHVNHASEPEHSTARTTDSESPTAAIEPIFHWFHQCGYCSLWQQFPSAHTFLPAIGKQAFIAHPSPIKHTPQALPPCDHYPHALTRAPPSLLT